MNIKSPNYFKEPFNNDSMVDEKLTFFCKSLICLA